MRSRIQRQENMTFTHITQSRLLKNGRSGECGLVTEKPPQPRLLEYVLFQHILNMSLVLSSYWHLGTVKGRYLWCLLSLTEDRLEIKTIYLPLCYLQGYCHFHSLLIYKANGLSLGIIPGDLTARTFLFLLHLPLFFQRFPCDLR